MQWKSKLWLIAALGFVLLVLLVSLLTTAADKTFPITFIDAISGRPVTNAVVTWSEWRPYPLLHRISKLPDSWHGRVRNVTFQLGGGPLRLPIAPLDEGGLRLQLQGERYGTKVFGFTM